MKKNAWVEYWKRVHKAYCVDGFGFSGEEDANKIKYVYIALFLGLTMVLSFLGFDKPLNYIMDILDTLMNSNNGLIRVLSYCVIIIMVGGFIYSIYFIYLLIKCLFIK